MSSFSPFILLPTKIFFDKRLTPTAKDILALIYTFSGGEEYFVPNQFFADKLNRSYQTISNSINLLIKLDYIYHNNLRGSNRSFTVKRSHYERPRR